MQAKRPQGNETTNPNEEREKGPPYELTPSNSCPQSDNCKATVPPQSDKCPKMIGTDEIIDCGNRDRNTNEF